MRKAFTLIEITIVVAIVCVLIALALPNFLRSRVLANEVAGIANLKVINNACQSFYGNQARYPNALNDLIRPASDPPYIDDILASGDKQNYHFTYTPNGDGFILSADPTGLMLRLNARHFYSDEAGIVHSNGAGPAGPGDPIIQ